VSPIRRKSLLDPDSRVSYPHGGGELVRVGSLAVGRARLEPGWRWSTSVRPLVGTASCEIHHFHVLLRGRLAIALDGEEPEEFGPGDVFDVPPGHDSWVVGDETVELLDVAGNVERYAVPTTRLSLLATILMSDIVDSTATANRVGETHWRQLLGQHNRVVRAELDRFRGHEVNTTGDGFVATFESAVSAVLCARAIRDGVRDLGIEVRIGVHTGEVEAADGEVGGIAIHAAARVMAAAGASEVLVSGVTRALAEGRGLAFEARGAHQLKGFAAPMELYAVD
jgi:class 3 adenylate cyclase